MSMYLGLSTFELFISVTQINEWSRVLNAKPLSLPSACLAAALSPTAVIVIFPLTRIYASL